MPGQAQPWAPDERAEAQIPRILHQLEKPHLLNSAGILGNECTGSSILNNTTNGHEAEIGSWADIKHKDGAIDVTETEGDQVLQPRLVSVTEMG